MSVTTNCIAHAVFGLCLYTTSTTMKRCSKRQGTGEQNPYRGNRTLKLLCWYGWNPNNDLLCKHVVLILLLFTFGTCCCCCFVFSFWQNNTNINNNCKRFAFLLNFKLQQWTDSAADVNLKMKKKAQESYSFYSDIVVSFHLQLSADEFLVYVITCNTQVFHPFLKRNFILWA